MPLALRRRPSHLVTSLVMGLAAGIGPVLGLTSDDLLRQGFSPTTAGEVLRSRQFQAPRADVVDIPIPPPFLTDGDAPAALDLPAPSRRYRQGGRKVEPVEGPTEDYGGREAAEIEGTFREVENFLLRPEHEYQRFVSMNESGLTGLIQTLSAEIAPRGTRHLRFGLRHTRFRRSFGQTLERDTSAIEQIHFPLVFMIVPSRDVELGVTVLGVDEESHNFGVIRDFSLAGISSIELLSKYRWLNNPEHRLSAAVAFGIRSAVESDVVRLGSNGVDYRFELAFTKRIDNLTLHLDGGFLFLNGNDRSNDKVPDIAFVHAGADLQTSDDLIFTLELTYQDFRDIGDNSEVTPGLKWRIAEAWRFDFGAPIALSNELAQGYFYRVTAAFQYAW